MATEKEMKEQLDVIKSLANKPNNVVEENYTRYYAVDKETHKDVYVHKHYNGMFVIGLAPSHPIRINKLDIVKISFDIRNRTASSFDVSGKKKQNAIKFQPNTKLCNLYIQNDDKIDIDIADNKENKLENDDKIHIDTVDNKENDDKIEEDIINSKDNVECFAFEPQVHGKVIEINKRLINNPKLVIESGDIEGYIAICESINYQWSGRKNNNAKKRKIQNIEDTLLTQQQYQEYLTQFNLNVNSELF